MGEDMEKKIRKVVEENFNLHQKEEYVRYVNIKKLVNYYIDQRKFSWEKHKLICSIAVELDWYSLHRLNYISSKDPVSKILVESESSGNMNLYSLSTDTKNSELLFSWVERVDYIMKESEVLDRAVKALEDDFTGRVVRTQNAGMADNYMYINFLSATLLWWDVKWGIYMFDWQGNIIKKFHDKQLMYDGFLWEPDSYTVQYILKDWEYLIKQENTKEIMKLLSNGTVSSFDEK